MLIPRIDKAKADLAAASVRALKEVLSSKGLDISGASKADLKQAVAVTNSETPKMPKAIGLVRRIFSL